MILHGVLDRNIWQRCRGGLRRVGRITRRHRKNANFASYAILMLHRIQWRSFEDASSGPQLGHSTSMSEDSDAELRNPALLVYRRTRHARVTEQSQSHTTLVFIRSDRVGVTSIPHSSTGSWYCGYILSCAPTTLYKLRWCHSLTRPNLKGVDRGCEHTAFTPGSVYRRFGTALNHIATYRVGRLPEFMRGPFQPTS